jgi:hypothetical protein
MFSITDNYIFIIYPSEFLTDQVKTRGSHSMSLQLLVSLSPHP